MADSEGNPRNTSSKGNGGRDIKAWFAKTWSFCGVKVKYHALVLGGFLVLSSIIYLIVFFTAVKGYRTFLKEHDVIPAVEVTIEGDLTSENSSRKWEVPNFVVSKETNSFALISRINNERKKHQNCPMDPSVKLTPCINDQQCSPGMTPSGNGYFSGKCKNSFCEISTWCSVQDPSQEYPIILEGLEDIKFTIKNWIKFAGIETGKRGNKYTRNNFIDVNGNGKNISLDNCLYDSTHEYNKYCPRFTVEGALRAANETMELKDQGCIIAINIDWNCYVNHLLKECTPKYILTRLDKNNIEGVNLWKYVDMPDGSRKLADLTLVRFIIRVSGVGRKFDVATLLVAIGSVFGIFATLYGIWYGLIPTLVPIIFNWVQRCYKPETGEDIEVYLPKLPKTSEEEPTPSGSADTVTEEDTGPPDKRIKLYREKSPRY